MLVHLENVCKSYPAPEGGPQIPVLKDIQLGVSAGEALAIVGPSGSGKSTLLNLLAALDRPTSGSIRFGGRELATLPDAELSAVRNRQIGLVFQQHHLLPQCTVLENVLLPTLAAKEDNGADARATRLLERVGLRHRLAHRPGQLSGGECQRVAVVRALINQPQLLLADEPTGSLDHATALQLGHLLLELNREEGIALVLVTHSRELTGLLPRALEIRDGHLLDPAV